MRRIVDALKPIIPVSDSATIRSETFIFATLIFGGCAVFFSGFFLAFGRYREVGTIAVMLGLFALALLHHRHSGSRLGPHLMLAAMTSALVILSMLDRGVVSPTCHWLFLVPALAALLLGRRGAVVMIGVVAVALTGLWVAEYYMGWQPGHGLTDSQFGLLNVLSLPAATMALGAVGLVADHTAQAALGKANLSPVALGESADRLAATMNDVGRVVGTLGVSADVLLFTGTAMEQGATEAVEELCAANALAEEARGEAQASAVAIEQMDDSILEISRSAGAATQVAQRALDRADEAASTIHLLGQTSVAIGSVSCLIAEIAQQTSLLALNARIESARAGDAGRGFAVVAEQVRILADQTASATGRIRGQVASIQSQARDAVQATDQVCEVAREITAHQVSIAAAVDEQSASMAAIRRSAIRTATVTAQISTQVNSANSHANKAHNGAHKTVAAAREIESAASDLKAHLCV